MLVSQSTEWYLGEEGGERDMDKATRERERGRGRKGKSEVKFQATNASAYVKLSHECMRSLENAPHLPVGHQSSLIGTLSFLSGFPCLRPFRLCAPPRRFSPLAPSPFATFLFIPPPIHCMMHECFVRWMRAHKCCRGAHSRNSRHALFRTHRSLESLFPK